MAQETVSTFLCSREPDVEDFLKTKAAKYEKTSKSRTYLIIDEESLMKKEIRIIAYFTLALKTLSIGSDVSKSKVKKLDGLFNKATNVTAYLIGQLGKNDLYKSCITGKEIIDYAVNIIVKVHGLIGGRFILVECNDNEKLIKFYNDNSFVYLQKDIGNGLVQLIRFL